jgi:hypothetical protein
LDAFVPGPPFVVLGNITIYKLARMVKTNSPATISSDSLKKHLTGAIFNKHSRNLFIHIESSAEMNVEAIFKVFNDSLANSQSVLCAGRLTSRSAIVFVRKEDYVRLPTSVFPDTVLTTYSCGGGAHPKYVHEALTAFVAATSEVATNMDIRVNASSAPSFEQLMLGVGRMTPEDLNTLKGQILTKPIEERSDEERAILRSFSSNVQVKRDRADNENPLLQKARTCRARSCRNASCTTSLRSGAHVSRSSRRASSRATRCNKYLTTSASCSDSV